jgi:hypothetical protein
MSEIETQLRYYFEAMVERISAEDVLAERRVLRTTTQPARRERHCARRGRPPPGSWERTSFSEGGSVSVRF